MRCIVFLLFKVAGISSDIRFFQNVFVSTGMICNLPVLRYLYEKIDVVTFNIVARCNDGATRKKGFL